MRLNAAVERELRAAKLRRDRIHLEEQFRQAQKMEAVGRLAGGVAHDFNNLLTVITGYSDMLLAGTRPQATSDRTALEEIRRSAERGGAPHSPAAGLQPQAGPGSRGLLRRSTTLVMQVEKMLRRLIGEDIELDRLLAAGSRGHVKADPGADRAGHHEPGGQCPRRHAERRQADHRNRESSTWTRAFRAKHLGVQPGRMSCIVGHRHRHRHGRGRRRASIFEPFFTTKEPARAPAWAWRPFTASSGRAAAPSGCTAKWAKAPPRASIYRCPWRSLRRWPSRTSPTLPLTGAETILLVEDEARVRKLIIDVLSGSRLSRARSRPRPGRLRLARN